LIKDVLELQLHERGPEIERGEAAQHLLRFGSA